MCYLLDPFQTHIIIVLIEQSLAQSEMMVIQDFSAWVSEIYSCVLFTSCGSNSGIANSRLDLHRFGHYVSELWGFQLGGFRD